MVVASLVQWLNYNYKYFWYGLAFDSMRLHIFFAHPRHVSHVTHILRPRSILIPYPPLMFSTDSALMQLHTDPKHSSDEDSNGTTNNCTTAQATTTML